MEVDSLLWETKLHSDISDDSVFLLQKYYFHNPLVAFFVLLFVQCAEYFWRLLHDFVQLRVHLLAGRHKSYFRRGFILLHDQEGHLVGPCPWEQGYQHRKWHSAGILPVFVLPGTDQQLFQPFYYFQMDFECVGSGICVFLLNYSVKLRLVWFQPEWQPERYLAHWHCAVYFHYIIGEY